MIGDVYTHDVLNSRNVCIVPSLSSKELGIKVSAIIDNLGRRPWALTHDITSIRLYNSYYIDLLKPAT